MTGKMLQRHRVLALAHDRAQVGEGFTRMDSAWVIGCFELASRIGELEAEGCHFDRENIRVQNRYGDLVRATRYTLTHAPIDVLQAAGIARHHRDPVTIDAPASM